MRREISLAVACAFAASAGLAQTSPRPRDLWIHPRGEAFQPELHYKDPAGELFYHAENDLEGALSDFTVEGLQPLRISIGVGRQLFARAAQARGSVRPVFLWDSDGDGKVDRSLAGRIEGQRAVFEAPLEIDLVQTRWQIGLRFIAGGEGDRALDRRYLASFGSGAVRAKLLAAPPPPVAAAPPPGLSIAKRSAGAPFDFDAFLAAPERGAREFTPLTREADGDAWTIAEDGGRLVAHFEQDDLFVVRATGGAELEVRWGDLPLERYLSENLRARADASGCYNTRDVALASEDGSPAAVPQRILYCPERAFAFFELPDGYEVELAAVADGARLDETEGGTSTRDNLRLYAREVNPRSASSRATGSVLGNVRASFADVGSDLADLGRHAVVGETRTHQHEGTTAYRVSPLSALPFAVYDLVRLQPTRAAGQIVTGVESGVQTVADLTSAAHNAVVVPLVQLSVGAAFSPEAADGVGDATGVLTATVARNLPASERTLDAWNPLSVPRHDRGYAPGAYTRTDAQLNIDRLVSVLDGIALGAVINHNRGGSDGDGGGVSGAVGGGKHPHKPRPKLKPIPVRCK
jgi:hypothetical protein